MKLPENDIPKSIFLDLSFEYFCFSSTYTKPIAIFCDKLFSIVFPDPVTDIVSDHRSENREKDRPYKMFLSPKPSDEDHHIHTRNRGSDNRQRLSTCRKKCNEIIPIPNQMDEITNPLDRTRNPIWFYKRNNNNRKGESSKEKGKEFCKEREEIFDHKKRE